MNAEMQFMKDNQVWNLVDVPPNCKTVGSKWLFKKKTDMDGNIHTYKARLVAKGFTQTYGVDYEETFLPIADIKAIRILIAITAYYNYKIWQIDVKTAFLNGRRSSKSWNKRFDEEIKKYGFTQNPDEPCVYKSASGSIIVFLILYVDDILLMGNNILMLQDVKSWLGKRFAMKDLDLRKYQGPSTLAKVKQMKGIPYASAVGSIMYVVRYTRPDVAFSQNLTSRYQQNRGESHWTTETDRDVLRSQTGFVFVMNRGAVDWKSSKQSTTAMSPMEAEYIVAAKTAMEAIWIRKFIFGLGVIPSIDKPMDMYYDNTGVVETVGGVNTFPL
ncbi:retrotransposon protein, putative, ty1-copia subclass [Tanacetum coccineum]